MCKQSWAQIDKTEKFPRGRYQQNGKIVNSLHQLAALQRFRLKLHTDRWNHKISKNHTQIINLFQPFMQLMISPPRCNAINGIENWIQKGLFP